MRAVLIVLLCAWLSACATPTAVYVPKPAIPETPNEPPISIAVSPKFAIQRTGVRITVRMAETLENRYLTVSLDGPTYRSRTEDWTDGQVVSPRIMTVTWDGVGEGHYLATAVLTRANGQTYQVYDKLCVAGMNTECGHQAITEAK